MKQLKALYAFSHAAGHGHVVHIETRKEGTMEITESSFLRKIGGHWYYSGASGDWYFMLYIFKQDPSKFKITNQKSRF